MAPHYKLASFHARSPQTEYKWPSFTRTLRHFNARIIYRIRQGDSANLRKVFSALTRVFQNASSKPTYFI